MVSWCSLKISLLNACTVLIFFIAGLRFRASSTSNIESVSHPVETGLLIPSGKRPYRKVGNGTAVVRYRDLLRVVGVSLAKTGARVVQSHRGCGKNPAGAVSATRCKGWLEANHFWRGEMICILSRRRYRE